MPNDTYKAGSNESRASAYQYNPKTGQWEPSNSQSSSQSSNISPTGESSLTTEVENSGSITVDSSSKVDSQAQADSEYIEIEYNTLQGELSLVANKKTISVKVGQTIKIEGLGKYLSGLYYVSAVKRTINNSGGYSHTLTVIKTGFGSTLKDIKVNQETQSSRPAQSNKTTTAATELKEGDKVMFLTVASNKYTYSNASDGVPVPKWVTEKVHTVDGVSLDGKRVRLKEIWSWTYVKFLKKV